MKNKEQSFDFEEQLTPRQISDGWHYCYSYDRILIGPGDKRMDNCKCKINKSIHKTVRKDEKL